MLTRELAIATFDNGVLLPDRLNRKTDAVYLGFADRILEIYRGGQGRTRRSLHQAVHRIFAEQVDCPERRIQAFCKLLDDESEFPNGDRRTVIQLRQSVFRAAAKHHPLVVECDALFESNESEIKRQIAADHGMDWPELHDRLFSDLIENQVLKKFNGYKDGLALLSRYNVAQTQAVLFDAVKISIKAKGDYKQILRYAKLARLMIRITKRQDYYFFEFDGPASVLRSTHRYGVAMARFLPGLLACRGWKMRATLRSIRFRAPIRFELDDACGLVSGAEASNAFDSSIEESFAKEWSKHPQPDWSLERETEILHRGQKVFFPDFVFVHRNGMRVMMEIVGFWTPEYLKHKADVLRGFRDQPIFLAIAQARKNDTIPLFENPKIYYKDRIKIAAVMEMLNKFLAC